MYSDIDDYSVSDLTDAYRSGKLTPVDVLKHKTQLMDAAEPTLHAMARRYDTNIATTKAAEESRQRWLAGKPLSRLDGVPVTIKENVNVIGEVTTWGSKAFADSAPATVNSPVYDLLKQTGCIILGKTAMPEWGMLSSGISTDHPTTCNAWNSRWNPGGSSSGAGTASASGYSPINFGSDIGGSVRLPASWNGAIGFKPTFARIPVDPPYFGRSIGILGRRIDDISTALGYTSGPDWRDPYSLPQPAKNWLSTSRDLEGTRIGLLLDAGAGSDVNPEVAAAVENVAKLFEHEGARITPLQPFIGNSIELIDMFWRAVHYRDYSALSEHSKNLMLPFIAEWCLAGSTITGGEAVRGSDEQLALAKRTLEATKDVDFIVSPVSPDATYPVDWPMPSNDVNHAMAHIAFCLPYNMSGQPALSLNCGFTSDRRPIGVQIAGQRYDEAGVLSIGRQYEQLKPESARVRAWPRIWEE
ncbi:amidase [Bifidobacterium thermophilum]|uniref:amidase n=1 Tax=Bifidobacterium thermophilum TaxID=33905 RepID=UPI003993303F